MPKVILDTEEVFDVDSRYDLELTYSKAANWRLWKFSDGNCHLLAGQFDRPTITKIIINEVEIDLSKVEE